MSGKKNRLKKNSYKLAVKKINKYNADIRTR